MSLRFSACIEPMYFELPFLRRFEAARKDGFEYVEFWNWTDKDLPAIKRAACDAGVKICGFNGDADLSLIDPAQKGRYLDFLKRSVDAALTVGASSLTIHSDGLGEGGRVLRDYRELSDTVKVCAMFDTLRSCAALAEESGVAMNLEPLNIITDHVGNFLVHAADAAALCGLIGSPKLKMLYDVYHQQLNEGNLCGNIAACAERIGHVHIADVPGRHEPGTGEIAWPRVLACLEESGYRGLVGCELMPLGSTAEAVKAIRGIVPSANLGHINAN